MVDKFCNPVTQSYDDFTVTWNKTLAGVMVEAPCTGVGLDGLIFIHDNLYIMIFAQVLYKEDVKEAMNGKKISDVLEKKLVNFLIR